MNSDHRRILMVGSIIVLGVLLILADVTVIVLFGITTVTGILFLGVNGSLNSTSPRSEPPSPNLLPSGPKTNLIANKSEGIFPSVIQSLKEAFRFAAGSIQGWSSSDRKKVDQVKKIDEMLDTLIAGNAVPSPVQPFQKYPGGRETGSNAPPSMDHFKEFSHATLEDDLLVTPPPSSGTEVRNVSERGIDSMPMSGGNPEITGTSVDTKVATTSLQPVDLEGMMNLGELELTDIEFEDANRKDRQSIPKPSFEKPEGSEAVSTISTVESDDLPKLLPQPMNRKVPKKSIAEKGDMSERSFLGSGDTNGNPLLVALRSDVFQLKKSKDMSLFREMKDVNVTTKELQSDLEEILSLLISTRAKKVDNAISSRTYPNKITR